MGKPRLVIVTNTFWPLVGAAETTAARLAIGLVDAGWEVTVLTSRQHESWPPRIRFHDALIERVGPPVGKRWAAWRFQLALGRWLRRHAKDYDLVYAFGLGKEASAALRAVGRRRSVVLRAQTGLPQAGSSWQEDGQRWQGASGAWLNAPAVVCRSQVAEQTVAAAGYPAERIHVIPDGVNVAPLRTARTRLDARNLLAEASNALRMPEWAPLAVYLGRLRNDRGLEYLAAAWPPLGMRWPNARLWLVGEGPFRDGLRRQISGLKLSGRVVMLGIFDHVEELLAAADVLVHPGASDSPSLAVAEAMGAGLPVIAAESSGHRILIEHDRTGLLVPPGNIEALTEAMMCIFDEPTTANRLGQAARDQAERTHALAQMVGNHLTLFQSLLSLPAAS